MKCDRYVGTGITKKGKDGESRLMTSNTRTIHRVGNGKIDNTLPKGTHLFDTGGENTTHGDLQGTASQLNGSVKSTIPIEALANSGRMKDSTSAEGPLEDDANRCIVIRMDNRKSNSSVEGEDGSRRNNENNITTCITDYEVKGNN